MLLSSIIWITIFFLLAPLQHAFPSSGLCPTAIVTSTPLGPPTCPGGGQLITITCFNTSVSYPACNGGGGTVNGTVYASDVIYFPAVQSNFNGLNETTVAAALDLLGARNASSGGGGGSAANITLIGGNDIAISSLNASAFLISFTGALSSAGLGFSLVSDGPGLVLNGIDAGPGIFISQPGNDVVIEADIAFSSSSVGGASIIESSSPSSLSLNELSSTIPLMTFSAGSGLVTLSSSVFCADGRPSMLFNGSAYCEWAIARTAADAACSGGASYQLTVNGGAVILASTCAAGALTMAVGGPSVNCSAGSVLLASPSSAATVCLAGSTGGGGSSVTFLNSSSVLFTSNGTAVYASALLTLLDASGTGASLISSYADNTGVLRTLLSGIPGFSLFVNASSITFTNPTICSDGRPSIVFNGTTCCNWYLAFGGPTANAPSGSVLFVSDALNTSWPLPGPAPYVPANPSLWPANITIVDQALNYLGIYRAQNGICPSAGQAMITVNGVSVCAVRIDPGPAITGCPAGVYTFDTGIATAVVCQPYVPDASTVSFLSNNPSFFSGCSVSPSNLGTYINCLGQIVQPLVNNVTSASTIYYYPPFPLACQTNVSLSALLTFLIMGQLPSNTFNVYINSVNGNDTCGGGTFANPWRTIAYALSMLSPVPYSAMMNIVLSAGNHTVVGDLYLPPNVQFSTFGALRFTTINVTGNIYLNATTWALFANDRVATGFAGIVLMYNTIILDYSLLGAYGPSSSARVKFYNCYLNGLGGIYAYGRGSVDSLNIANSDVNNNIYANCATLYFRGSTISNANIAVSDANCTTPSVQTFAHQMSDDAILGTSSIIIVQQTSLIEVDMFANGFDEGSLTASAAQTGRLQIDASDLPLALFYDANVTFLTHNNLKSVGMLNLSAAYWGATQLTGDAMMLILQSYAKTLATSGAGGVSLIGSSSLTTNTLRELTSLSPQLSFSANATTIFASLNVSALQIPTNFADATSGSASILNYVNTSTVLFNQLASGSPSELSIATNGAGLVTFTLNLTALRAEINTNTFVDYSSNASAASILFAVNGTGVFFNRLLSLTPNSLSIVSGGNGLLYLTVTPPTLVSLGGGTSLVLASNATQYALRGLVGTANVVLTTNGTDVLIGVSATPSFTSLTLSTPLAISSGGTGAASLTGNGLVGVNAGGTALTSTTLTDGQLLIGSTGSSPVAATISGTASQVSIANGAGSITASIPSTFVAPGTIQDTTGFYLSSSVAVTAAGATQGTATALTTSFNVITTVTASTGVALPTPSKAGLLVTVVNRGANPLAVYPASGGTIDGAVLNAPVTLPSGTAATYEASSTTQWYTVVPAISGSGGTTVTYGNGGIVISSTASSSNGTIALQAGSNIVITPGIGTNNYSIATSLTPTFTSLTLSTPLMIASGGTGAASLTGNGVVGVNAGGTALTSTTLTNGQLLIGSTGSAPVAATIAGTANQVSIANGAGSITASTPSTFIAPGTVKDTSGMYHSTTTGIAAAGATQGTATALTTSYNIVTSVAASTGVALPTPAAAGLIITIENRGANTLNVYPASGGTIDAAAANAPVTIPANGVARYEASSTTQWYTTTPVLAGAGGISTAYGNGVVTATMTATPSFTSLTLSNPLAVSSGGTGTASLIGNALVTTNAGGTALTATAMTNGQLAIGNTGSAPTFGTISGTASQITITNGAGTITASVPSTFVAPGNMQDTSGLYLSTITGISAAGATQGTATAITTSNNVVSTVAAGTGVILPTPAKAGFRLTVENRGANALLVYPASGGTIDSAAANAAVSIPSGAAATYLAASTTQWFTAAFPVVADTTSTTVSYGNGQLTVGNNALPQLFSNTATLTQNNPGSNVFVTMIPGGSGTLTVPANALTAGAKVRFMLEGYFSITGSTQITFQLLMDGGVIYTSASSSNVGASTNVPMIMSGGWNVFTSGVSGTILGNGLINVRGSVATGIVSTTTTAYNTTAAHTFDLRLAYSGTNAANTFSVIAFSLFITKV